MPKVKQKQLPRGKNDKLKKLKKKLRNKPEEEKLKAFRSFGIVVDSQDTQSTDKSEGINNETVVDGDAEKEILAEDE